MPTSWGWEQDQHSLTNEEMKTFSKLTGHQLGATREEKPWSAALLPGPTTRRIWDCQPHPMGRPRFGRSLFILREGLGAVTKATSLPAWTRSSDCLACWAQMGNFSCSCLCDWGQAGMSPLFSSLLPPLESSLLSRFSGQVSHGFTLSAVLMRSMTPGDPRVNDL